MSEVDRKKAESFEAVARPVIKWMAENCHPHTAMIVDAIHAELLEADMVINTHDYLVD
jgi:hypothetical protein